MGYVGVYEKVFYITHPGLSETKSHAYDTVMMFSKYFVVSNHDTNKYNVARS